MRGHHNKLLKLNQRNYLPQIFTTTMVVMTTSLTPLSSSSSSSPQTQIIFSSCKQISPSLLLLHQIQSNPTTRLNNTSKRGSSSYGPVLSIKAYMENQNSVSGFVNRVIGALPVVGLIARIISDEGGVGEDIIDFAEFRRRIGKKSTLIDTKAFFDFQERHGRAGDPLYVLMCCWLAAVGAGLLKSEEILEGAARLRVSNDIEFEEQKFISMMSEAKERRAKSNVTPPTIPMEARAEKALEAIYICCFAKELVEEEDERILNIMLSAVFRTVKQAEIERIVKDKAKKVAEGGDDGSVPEPRPLSKEAVKMQMKDLRFLQQNSES